jgi:hypothetical protein
LVYPNRKFIFVDVDNYDGPGSSQVYSMNKCKEYLQEPFIYNDCDTICSYFDIDLNFNHDTLYGFKLNNYGHINYDTFDVVSGEETYLHVIGFGSQDGKYQGYYEQ